MGYTSFLLPVYRTGPRKKSPALRPGPHRGCGGLPAGGRDCAVCARDEGGHSARQGGGAGLWYLQRFSNPDGTDYAEIEIYVGDLELVTDNGLTDEEIMHDLPKHDPRWWCKVEDGYILNLLGERKNKIAYDYEN